MTYEENNKITSIVELNNKYNTSSNKINIMAYDFGQEYRLRDGWFGFEYYDGDTTDNIAQITRSYLPLFNVSKYSSYEVKINYSDVTAFREKLITLKTMQNTFSGLVEASLISGAVTIIQTKPSAKMVIAGLTAIGLFIAAVTMGSNIWLQASCLSVIYDEAVTNARYYR